MVRLSSLLRPRPSFAVRLFSPSSLLPLFVMSGGVCPAVMKPLWSPAPEQCVGADMSLFCSQVVVLKSHRAHQLVMQLPDLNYTRHFTVVQVFKRCHICLNTGIKLAVRVEEEEEQVCHWWQERDTGGGERIFHNFYIRRSVQSRGLSWVQDFGPDL